MTYSRTTWGRESYSTGWSGSGQNTDYYLVVGLNGHLWKYDLNTETWSQKTTGTSYDLIGLHGTPYGSFIVACGEAGTVLYSTDAGDTWSPLGSFPPTSYTLVSCWVLSPVEVWVVGSRIGYGEGKAWVWNGFVWTESTSQASYWNGIAALSSSSVYAGVDTFVGGGIWHNDGSGWSQMAGSTDSIESIYPDTQDPTKLYAHFNASHGYGRLWYGSLDSWAMVHPDAYRHAEARGRSLWVDENGKVWMAGTDSVGNGRVRSWDGSTLTTEFEREPGFTGIFGRSSSDIIVTGVASGGNNYETFRYDGSTWNQITITGGESMRSVWAPLFAGYEYAIQQDDTATASDAPDIFQPGDIVRNETINAIDGSQLDRFSESPNHGADVFWFEDLTAQAYELRVDDTVFARDSYPVNESFPTAPLKKPYSPILDLGLVRATYTSVGRYYMARAHIDGTAIQPYRYELGSGWENPRWGAIMQPSPDATGVTAVVYEGTLSANQLKMETANDRTLVIRIVGPISPTTQITEVMVYAKIVYSPLASEIGSEIAFACAVFPSWFHATNQRFILRMVLPL